MAYNETKERMLTQAKTRFKSSYAESDVSEIKRNREFPEDIITNYVNRVEATTVVKNRYYLFVDMRPASVFASTAAKFKSKIQVRVDGKTVDAKSILMLWGISNHLTRGKSFTIIAEGADAAEAVDSLLEMVAFRFGEE